MADPDNKVLVTATADPEPVVKTQDSKDLVGPQFIRCLFPGDLFGPVEGITVGGTDQEVAVTKAKAIVEAARDAQVRLIVRPVQND